VVRSEIGDAYHLRAAQRSFNGQDDHPISDTDVRDFHRLFRYSPQSKVPQVVGQ